MELEDRRRITASAPAAEPAKKSDRAELRLPPKLDDPGTVRLRLYRVTQLVAIRANEIAFLRLFAQSRQRPVEFPQPKVLGRGIAVMELERFGARGIAAVDAAAAIDVDQVALSLPTAFVK